MNSTSPEIDLQRVKDEIRSEAEALRARAPAMPAVKPRPVVASNRAYDTSASEYSIANLCQFHFTTFVDYAYRAVLKRPPDAAGFDGHLKLLVSGGSKIEILGNLRYSAEGRRAAVRVPGLLPRYALAKLYRVPLIGYFAEWLTGFASLPGIMRHQRASDTFHVARSYEIDTARRETSSQMDAVVRDNLVLRKEIGNVVDRVSAMRSGLERAVATLAEVDRVDIRRVSAESAELRHLVLSMNHWLTTLRQNLGALERAEHEDARRADALHAEIVERMWRDDSARLPRLATWSAALARGLQPSAQILDLASGHDWLAALGRSGLHATGVDPSEATAERARAAGSAVSAAEPSAVLARLADGALDGLTALASTALLQELPASQLLATARRVLRPGGVLLFAFDIAPSLIRDRMAGRAEPLWNDVLLAHALAASGFIDIETLTAADGARCVMARTPGSTEKQ